MCSQGRVGRWARHLSSHPPALDRTGRGPKPIIKLDRQHSPQDRLGRTGTDCPPFSRLSDVRAKAC